MHVGPVLLDGQGPGVSAGMAHQVREKEAAQGGGGTAAVEHALAHQAGVAHLGAQGPHLVAQRGRPFRARPPPPGPGAHDHHQECLVAQRPGAGLLEQGQVPGVAGPTGPAGPLQVGDEGVAVGGQGALAPLQAHQRAALVGERLQHRRPRRQLALLVGVVQQAERTSLRPHDRRRRAGPFVDQGAHSAPAVLGRHLAQVERRGPKS